MKDYKLSEIKAICKRQGDTCYNCELRNECGRGMFGYGYYGYPADWQIDEEGQDE